MSSDFSFRKLLLAALITSSLAACGGSDSEDVSQDPPPVSGGGTGNTGGDGNTGSPGNDGGNDNTDPDGDPDLGFIPGGLSFNIQGAHALQTLESSVTQVASLSTQSSLFNYQQTSLAMLNPALLNDEDVTSGNLLSVDEDGNASFALESDFPVKVMYSVMAPDGGHVYIALSDEWDRVDNISYGDSIAQLNCSLLKVSTADNSYECVAEGILVQAMNDEYLRSISNNSKPLIFDGQGSLYFAGRTFDQHCYDDGYCYMQNKHWTPIVYRYNPEEAELTQITNDLQHIESFQVLGNGQIVYYGYNEGSSRQELNLFNDPGTSLLSENWGVEFFTVDSDNTVIFGDSTTDGVRFARPREGGGIERTSLNTSLFGQSDDGNNWATPVRVLTGDDGRMYGIFNGSRSTYDPATDSWSYADILSVYQVFPYDANPVAVLELNEAHYWWDWMRRTPFQINKGYLYYVEREEVDFHGQIDVINMVRIEDREVTRILNANTETERFMLHNWRLSGDTLYFSAQNNANTTTVTGQIDTLAVRDGKEVSEFLTFKEVASARGAAVAVSDIEILRPEQPVVDTGSRPEARFFAADENLYSMSVDFTKYMNRESVMNNLSLADESGVEVPVMPVWFYQTLHLIPDTSDRGLGDAVEGGLKNNTTYTLALGENTRDAWDWDLTGDKQVSVTTLPKEGWIPRGSSSEVPGVMEGLAARYLGYRTEDNYNYLNKTFVVHDDLGPILLTEDFRIEFSARNLSWGDKRLVVNRVDGTEQRTEIALQLDPHHVTVYYYEEGHSSWPASRQYHYRDFYSENWKRFRLDVTGNVLMFSASQDGIDFDEIARFPKWDGSKYVEAPVDDLTERDVTVYDYTMGFELNREFTVDKLEISDLTDPEDPVVLFSENFNNLSAADVQAIFVEAEEE